MANATKSESRARQLSPTVLFSVGLRVESSEFGGEDVCSRRLLDRDPVLFNCLARGGSHVAEAAFSMIAATAAGCET